jgi:hypothetical protein
MVQFNMDVIGPVQIQMELRVLIVENLTRYSQCQEYMKKDNMNAIVGFDHLAFLSLSFLRIFEPQQDPASVSDEDEEPTDENDLITLRELSTAYPKERQLSKFLDSVAETFSREKIYSSSGRAATYTTQGSYNRERSGSSFCFRFSSGESTTYGLHREKRGYER